MSELQTDTRLALNFAPTREEAEREQILWALHETRWAIGEPSGAAARLGLKRATLHSKCKSSVSLVPKPDGVCAELCPFFSRQFS